MNRPAGDAQSYSGIILRHVTLEDGEVLSALNNQAYPAVPMTSPEEMAALIDLASWGQVASLSDEVVGFVLCVMPGVAYESENYRFFENSYPSHLYIDRIVIDSTKRGMGLGTLMYRKVFQHAIEEGCPFVTCEVNLDPPNPLSQKFHQRMGFEQVGTQQTKGGSVTVSLLAAAVGDHRGG